MSITEWLEKYGAYYDAHPNEPIYAHTLLQAMRAVEATDLSSEHQTSKKANPKPPGEKEVSNG